jgi:hypothetical protein
MEEDAGNGRYAHINSSRSRITINSTRSHLVQRRGRDLRLAEIPHMHRRHLYSGLEKATDRRTIALMRILRMVRGTTRNLPFSLTMLLRRFDPSTFPISLDSAMARIGVGLIATVPTMISAMISVEEATRVVVIPEAAEGLLAHMIEPFSP